MSYCEVKINSFSLHNFRRTAPHLIHHGMSSLVTPVNSRIRPPKFHPFHPSSSHTPISTNCVCSASFKFYFRCKILGISWSMQKSFLSFHIKREKRCILFWRLRTDIQSDRCLHIHVHCCCLLGAAPARSTKTQPGTENGWKKPLHFVSLKSFRFISSRKRRTLCFCPHFLVYSNLHYHSRCIS